MLQHEVFACPGCKKTLTWCTGHASCQTCKQNFQVTEGYISFLANSDSFQGAKQNELQGREDEAHRYELDQVRMKGRSYHSMVAKRLRREMATSVAGPILDLGAGTGMNIKTYASLQRKIFALDFSEASLAFLYKKKIRVLEIVHGDACTLPFQNEAFGCIVCYGLVQHMDLKTRSDVFREARRCLKPNGKFVVSAYNAMKFSIAGQAQNGSFQGSNIPYYSFTRTQLREELEAAGFVVKSIKPLGIFLFLQSMPIRGATFLYRTFSLIWSALEVALLPVVGKFRGLPSEYLVVTAYVKKP